MMGRARLRAALALFVLLITLPVIVGLSMGEAAWWEGRREWRKCRNLMDELVRLMLTGYIT